MLFSLAEWARQQLALRDYLERTSAARLAAYLAGNQAPDDLSPALWQYWEGRFRAHLNMYGCHNTGAGRGMGVDFVQAAFAAGHQVVASGRNPEAVAKAVAHSAVGDRQTPRAYLIVKGITTSSWVSRPWMTIE